MLLGVAAAAAAVAVYPPEQVHLALGRTVGEMSVAWATYENSIRAQTGSIVEWGTAPDKLAQTATGDVRGFSSDLGRHWHTHTAKMTGLQPNTRYWYRVGDNSSMSKTFEFVSQTAGPTADGSPRLHVLLGDMGSKCAFTLCLACSCASEVCDAATCATNRTDAGIIAERNASMILHVGDFGYDLASNKGTTGDNFMRNIEQIAGYVPYMVSHGNHEDAPGSLSHYLERFRHMPVNSKPAWLPTLDGSGGTSPNTLYFSWDEGLVHYVAISTELWFDPLLWAFKHEFLKWIQGDLQAANKNRAAVPWIVVHGHRSMYCSCDADCDKDGAKLRADLEDIFFQQGVDLFVNGHEHNYERGWPTYKNKTQQSNVNPTATIYVVTGAAGSKELHEPFTRPQPPRTAFRSNTFGYTRMYVHNASHIHWQQVQTDPTFFPGSDYGRVIDDVWIVQQNHGPFDPKRAPTDRGVCTADTCRQYDHWGPLLGMDPERTDQHIAKFRSEQGESAWLQRLESLRQQFAQAQNNRGQVWEDVRSDGNSDSAWVGWKGRSA